MRLTITDQAGDSTTVTGDTITITATADADEAPEAATADTQPGVAPAPVEGSPVTGGDLRPTQAGSATTGATPEPASAPETPAEAPQAPITAEAVSEATSVDLSGPSDEAEGTVQEPGAPVVIGDGIDLADPEVSAVVHQGGPAGRFTLDVDGDTRQVEADNLGDALAREFADGAQRVTVTRVEAAPGTEAP